jgi:hypothetical protein
LSVIACFVGAAISTLFILVVLIAARFPKLLGDWNVEERPRGRPLSTIDFFAWALCAATWTIALFAARFRHSLIVDRTGWLLAFGFITVVCAASHDWIRSR